MIKRTNIRERKKNKGITLIALVITIVILIILAVVTVNAVFGDSGLLKYAQDAGDYQANADTSDASLLNDATSYIDGIVGGNGGTETGDDIVPTTVEEAKAAGGENVYFFENTTDLRDGENNIVKLPGGFGVSKDSGINVEDGVVIEDEEGNQFVWIPVGTYNTTKGEKNNNLSRRSWGEANVVEEPIEVNGDDLIDEYFYGEGNSNSVANNTIDLFKTSSIENRGFYIGRYEAGTEIERTSESEELTVPLVQANKNVYVYVTRDEAKMMSESMYSESQYVKSELISSYAWDTALNFICQNSEVGYLLATTTDSTYGNIYTDSINLTGTYVADKYSNIYDFIGNCFEWTTEYSTLNSSESHGPCVPRGGRYGSNYEFAASRRYGVLVESSSYDFSFRMQLYIIK